MDFEFLTCRIFECLNPQLTPHPSRLMKTPAAVHPLLQTPMPGDQRIAPAAGQSAAEADREPGVGAHYIGRSSMRSESVKASSANFDAA